MNRPITVTFDEQEIAAFGIVCDAACRQGMQAAAPAVALLQKVQQAARQQLNGGKHGDSRPAHAN